MTTQTEKNRAIHEWMGECGHEWERKLQSVPVMGQVTSALTWKCKDCNDLWGYAEACDPEPPPNPDYFTPEGFFKVKDGIRRLGGPDILKVDFYNHCTYEEDDPDSLPNRLYAWIKETK